MAYLITMLILLLLIAGSGIYVFCNACLRRDSLPWLDEKQIKETAYAKYYNWIVDANNWLKAHEAKDIYITNEEGLELHGFWVPAENPRGTLLLSHGYRSTLLLDLGLAFSFYHERRFNLLIPEHRCHGKSQGKYITFGVKESRDIAQWISYHNNTFGAYPLFLSGLSMGASTVMYLADKALPDNVLGMIADCGFTSPKEILYQVFRDTVHLPPQPSIWFADILARLIAGFSLNQEDTRKTLANSKLPIFMIHGGADDFVPCHMTLQAYEVCNSSKVLMIAENAAHGTSFIEENLRYVNLLEQFLSDCLGEKI